MATIRGEAGSVTFETGSGSLAAVVGTRSWSLSVTKETLDTTVHGNTYRQFVGSLISGSGTVELVYDPDASGQPGFIEDVMKTGDTADASFELFTTGSSSGTDSLAFGGIITGMEINSTVGDLVIVSCTFITSSTITSNLE